MSTLGTTEDKHKVFISFHHKDEHYKDTFETSYGHLFTSKSVENGDIDPDNEDEYIKRLIQEGYISDSSVVVAIYGKETKGRKHVDWEISAGLSAKVGGHSGLVVLIVPGFPASPFDTNGRYQEELLYPHLHPRTVANLKSGYTKVYFWPGMHPNLYNVEVANVLQEAFDKRITHKKLIDNSNIQYRQNR